MLIDTNETLLLIGDSITDAGRARPVGSGSDGGLGSGYAAYVNSVLSVVYPQRHIRVLNTGISGNTVRDLENRWSTDVFDLNPDWLSIMIGTNDVWRQFDALDRPEIHVLPAEFEERLDRLVHQTLPKVKGLVLMTPFLIEPDVTDPMRAMMDRYGQIVKSIAQRQNALFVDTQAAYNAVLQHSKPEGLSGDRVHPNQVGHMVLASALLTALELEWPSSK